MSDDLDRRITSLETWKNKMEGDLKVDAVRREYMDKRFNAVEDRLSKIDGHIAKLVWLILTAIVTGVMGFIISGGLSG